MIKLRTIIIIVVIYVITYLSVTFNVNILYPYYLFKDIILYPVHALTDNKDLVIETKNNVSKDEIIEADEYLNNAIYSCSQNNYNDVGVNYHKFLEKLNSLD